MEEWTEVKSDTGIWVPTQKGEQIEGEVVEIRKGLYGIQLVIETSQGNKLTTPSHKALQSRLVGFQVGDFIKVVFQGADLPKVKGQQGTRLYAVFRKPSPADVEPEDVV